MSQNNILVPVNLSEQSLIALEQSYNIAKHTDSVITLLYVGKDPSGEIKAKLDALAREVFEKSGNKAKVLMLKGNVYKQILKTAKKINAVMIILGVNASKKIRNIGNNAFRVVREAACPVITIKGRQHRSGCKNIVLPLDLTRETREKVKQAIEFAKFFGAAVRVVSVRLPKEIRQENKLIAYSHQVKNFIKEKKIDCTIKTLIGTDIAKLVVNYAHEEDADLIMIMTQKEINFKELFVGTVAQKIVNTSDIPVLSIRPMRRGFRSV